MSAAVDLAKHDKLESRIRTAEAKRKTWKWRGETAKAEIELNVIAELLTQQLSIVKKLRGLEESGGGSWRQMASNHGSQTSKRWPGGIESAVKAN
jgi:hypothetical protein